MGTLCRVNRACLAVAAVWATACGRTDPATEAVSQELRRQLEEPASRRGTDKGVWPEVQRFYEHNQYRPAWFKGKRPRSVWNGLTKAVEGVARHGLDPQAYGLDGLQERRQKARRGLLRREYYEPVEAAEIDIRLTHAFVLLASHLANGELDPPKVNPLWSRPRDEVDVVSVLDQALQSKRIEQALRELAPHDQRYERLAGALQATSEADVNRRRTLELNLERWRWLPRDLGERYLVVNVPTFDLRLYEQGRQTMQMRVVVGRTEDPTPLFSDAITHIVFSPTWNVPPGILEDEIIPALKEDDSYLEKAGLEMVKDGKVVEPDEVDLDDPKSFQVRQPPGPENALGQVKFLLPNRFNVYLHDTPFDGSFVQDRRAFSHGCIRLQQPVELAERLLADQPKWTPDAIKKAMASGQEQAVKIQKRLPVHIVYWTAWVDEGGTVQIADDVYGRDRSQAAVLARARERRVPSGAEAVAARVP